MHHRGAKKISDIFVAGDFSSSETKSLFDKIFAVFFHQTDISGTVVSKDADPAVIADGIHPASRSAG